MMFRDFSLQDMMGLILYLYLYIYIHIQLCMYYIYTYYIYFKYMYIDNIWLVNDNEAIKVTQ